MPLTEKWASWTNEWAQSGLQDPDDAKESDTTDKAHNPQNSDDPDESSVTDAAENHQDSQTSKTSDASTRAWSPLTSAQIFIWLAILISIGISPKRSLADHWKTSQVVDIQPSDPFIKYMTFPSFQEILKYLRIFPPFEKIEDDGERMTFRVREWSDHIKTTSTSLFTGSELQDATQRKKTESITKNRRKNNRLYQQFSRGNDHNDHLGGVDIHDHLRKDIGYNHRYRRGTWQAVAWSFLLDTVLVNTYILQRESNFPYGRNRDQVEWRTA